MVSKLTVTTRYKKKLALLISAHNEEFVIEQTLRSAMRAGMKPADIFVVDDASNDNTSKIARGVIGNNVMRVRRSGKGLALSKAARKFCLSERYQWIHIADADGGFAPDYFYTFRKELRVENAAATGYVRSLPGSSVSQFRVFEYTIGMELHRRFQSLINTVSVIPGPTSCFRSDVFSEVDFANKSLTEDFDVTLQIHRKKLGNIQFISHAVAYTQDPQTLKDFIKQTTRWNRGTAQGMRHHKIGRRVQRIDAYLSFQIFQSFLFFLSYTVVIPFLAIRDGSLEVVAAAFLFDCLFTFALCILVAMRSRRWDLLSSFPIVYGLRWILMGVFLKSFVEVFALGRFKETSAAWSTDGRRYKPSATI